MVLERRKSPTVTSSPMRPFSKTGVKVKLVADSMGVARGLNWSPLTALMEISLPSGTA